ncbi:hypothetical protein N7509_010305 [Penicillium cosmopolitanum]|uniref:F-box domain-containing protein n=1 Tax=Penicillium cosmopolitanum TaxID=1131564 RepID=A0A9W9VRD4_9EURO|nr:uncharacterized protein N7509_010305 [Penicillium cosmopolitanum]KAJ5387764.1 hypothetical protein N7509_010305 [Penicillium cosmopolitanum]
MNSSSLLDTLPTEILLCISSHISRTSDLLHFLCTNRTLHDVLFLELCKRDISNTGGQAIVAYAENGYENGVRCMLAAGVDVDVKGPEGSNPTALGAAVSAHRLGIAKLLLDHGADIHNTSRWEDPALVVSTYYIPPPRIDTSLFELLLDYKADVNRSGFMGTPLSLVAEDRDVKMMKFFLSKGADPNMPCGYRKGDAQNPSRRRVLDVVAERNTPLEALTILLEAGAKVEVQNRFGLSPLHLVIMAKKQALIDRGKVEALLRFGANVNIPRGFDHQRGQCSCRSGHLNSDSSAPVVGLTALHIAARSKCANGTEVMAFLLENGADVNAIDHQGCTPLLLAKAEKSGEEKHRRLETLLQHGADINARDNTGCSVLHYQAHALSSELIKWLCDLGCDVNWKNDVGVTPIIKALETPHSRSSDLARRQVMAVETLIFLGATVNQISSESKSPLGLAVRHQRSPDLTRLILEQGADVHHRDPDGKTHLQWVLRVIDFDEIEDGLQPDDAVFDRRGLADLLLKYSGDLNDVAPLICTPGGEELWGLDEIIEYAERKSAEEIYM